MRVGTGTNRISIIDRGGNGNSSSGGRINVAKRIRQRLKGISIESGFIVQNGIMSRSARS